MHARFSLNRAAALVLWLLLALMPALAIAQGPPDLSYSLVGHSSTINSVAVSPNGTYYATASGDTTIKIWRVSDNTLYKTLNAHTGAVNSVAFSADSQSLVSSSADSTIREWDVASGIQTLVINTGQAQGVALSPDGSLIAAGFPGSSGNLYLFNAVTGAATSALSGHTGTVWSVAFSPDGTKLLTSSEDGTARIWQVSTGNTLFTLNHGSALRSAVWSPDGTKVATGGTSGVSGVKIWNPVDGSLTSTLTDEGSNNSLAFSPDSARLAVQSQNRNSVWNVSTATRTSTFGNGTGNRFGIAWLPGGTSVLAASGNPGNLSRYRASDGFGLGSVTNFLSAPYSAYSPDGSLLATADGYGTVNLRTASTGAVIRSFVGSGPVAFSADGSTIAYSLVGTTLQTVSSGAILRTLGTTPQALTFSADGTSILIYTSNTLYFYRLLDGALLNTVSLSGLNSSYSYVFSPDKTKLAIGGFILISGGYRHGIGIYSAVDGSLINAYYDAVVSSSSITTLDWTGDGTTLITGSGDQRIRAWDVATGNILYRVGNTPTAVSALAVSPFGDTFTAARSDRSVTIYKVTDGSPLQYYNEETGTGLSYLTYSLDASRITWGRTDSTLLQTINPFPVALATISVNPNFVTAGASAVGTVTLNVPAPVGGVSVALASSDPSVTVQSSVLVPQGATTATFSVFTASVSTNTTVTLSANYNGATRYTTIRLQPSIAAKSVAITPATITGGYKAYGVLTLTQAAPAGGLIVSLSSSQPAVATVPGTLTIPAGKRTLSFPINTSAVLAAQNVTISLTSGGVTKTAPLTVVPAALSSLAVLPATLAAGDDGYGIIYLVAPATTDVTVKITATTKASPSNRVLATNPVTFPITVTIPAGSISAIFDLTALSPALTGTETSAKVTLKAQIGTGTAGTTPGVTSKTAVLTVTP